MFRLVLFIDFVSAFLRSVGAYSANCEREGRSQTAGITKRLLAAFALLLLGSSALGAQYQISATGTTLPGPVGGTITTTDWTLVFDDTSGDGLLQVSEIVSFSGTRVTNQVPTAFQYDAIVSVPTITGISAGSGSNWVFTGPVTSGPQDAWSATRWTYEKTAISELVEVDLTVAGDGLLTLDPNTGLG